MPEHYRKYKSVVKFGTGFTFALTSALLLRDELITAWKTNYIFAILVSALFIVTAFRFLLYFLAVESELFLLNTAFDFDSVKRIHGPVLMISFAISICFAIKIAFVMNILIYSIVAFIFSIADLYGPATVNQNLANRLLGQKFSDFESSKKAEILFDYYFNRPLLLRVAIILTMASISMISAVFWHFTNQLVFRYSSYLIWIITIILGEILIYRWRTKRDDSLAELSSSNHTESNKTVENRQESDGADVES